MNSLFQKACRTLIFLIVGLQLIPAHAYASQGQVLKILELNFNSEVVLEDGDYRFRDRRYDAIIQWINDNNPDIVMIAEGWNYHGFFSIVQALALAVNYDYTYRVGMGIPFVLADSDGILVKKNLKLDQTQGFKLPHSGASIGNGQGWVAPLGANSYAVGGRITLQDGSSVYVYATHLISKGGADDPNAIHAAIVKQAEDNGEDVNHIQAIVAGDFNTTPTEPASTALIAHGYRDTYADAHPDLSSTEEACTNCMVPTSQYYNPMTIAPGLFPAQATLGGNDRIDYIFTLGQNTHTLASTVAFTHTLNDLWMSDHYGVVSSIVVGGDAPASTIFPNPTRDSVTDEHALVIHLTDENLTCDQVSKCTTEFPDSEISAAKGITFINDTSHKVRITINGSGQVWPRNHDVIKKNQATAFYFTPGEEHSFIAKRVNTRKKLVGNLTAQ